MKHYTIEDLRQILCRYADPPLCRVCNEPLELGSGGPEGVKWAHYVRGEPGSVYDKAAMDHYDKSIQWNPPRDKIVERVVRELLEVREREELDRQKKSRRDDDLDRRATQAHHRH